MVQKAEATGFYDSLHVGDCHSILQTLLSSPDDAEEKEGNDSTAMHAVIAADTFIYIGEFECLFFFYVSFFTS